MPVGVFSSLSGFARFCRGISVFGNNQINGAAACNAEPIQLALNSQPERYKGKIFLWRENLREPESSFHFHERDVF